MAAASAWYAAGRHVVGAALAVLSVVYHASVYASGQRLLASRPAPTEARPIVPGAPR